MKKVSPLAVSSSPLTVACCALKRAGLLAILILNTFIVSAQTNCPDAGIFEDIPDICEGEELSLEVRQMTNMDSLDNGEADFGVTFVSFPGVIIPSDPYTGGDSITTVEREGLLGGADGFYRVSTTGGSDLTADSYIICTILSPVPSDPACRPTNCQQVNILGAPVVTFADPDDICEGERAVLLETGEPFGGTYSGVGVQDDGRGGFEFNPDLSGVGIHTISYTVSNRDGCSTTVMNDIEVFANPIATINDPEDRCTGGADAIFVGGPNATGTFDSDAILGFLDNGDGTATLDVSTAGVGTYTVNYNYTDDNGCSGIASSEISICLSPCPVLDLFAALPDLCEFEDVNLIVDRMTLMDSLDNQEQDYGILFTIFSGIITPADPYIGGDSLTFVERGDLLGGADGFYNLNTTVENNLTPGSYNICATLNPLPGDPACRPFLCETINILSAPDVTLNGQMDFCDDDLPVSLDMGDPSGGTYSGTGVQSDGRGGFEFSPVLAGGGVHIITYEITNRDGCSNTATDTIMVFPLPMLTFFPPATICENTPAFELIGTPTGGTFSGTGVVGNNFDSGIAGVGMHMITYDFMDINNCSNMVSDTIEVFAAPVVSFSALADLCIDGGIQTNISGGSPAGGIFSGTGVTDNGDGTYNFDPTIVGVGVHDIEYVFTDGNGCEGTATDMVEIFELPIVTFTAPANLCIDAGIQSDLGGGTPVDGIYSGSGVIDDGNGGTYSFDPATAGVGTHLISYAYSTPNAVEVVDNIGFDAITNFTISDLSSTSIASDDFTLTVDQDIVMVEWSGVYSSSTPTLTDDFTIVIYDDGGGMPGTALTTIPIGNNVIRTDTGMDLFDMDIYSYNATIPSFSAIAGVTYWISIYTDTPVGNTWAWSRKTGGGNAIASRDQGANWDLVLSGEIDFRLSASAVSCTNTATDTIEVFATPVVSFTALSDLCVDAGIQMNIASGSPTGGIFSGSGVTDNGDGTYNFDPTTAGVGVHTIEYIFTDVNSCDDIVTDMVEVFATPIVSFIALPDLCENVGIQMNIIGGNPTGGTHSGSGVVDNGDGTYNFDPAIAGVGIHTIEYTFTDGNSCDDTVSDMVEVFAAPISSFTALADLCIDGDIQASVGGGNPTGGIYSGSGVTDNGDGTYDFDPATAGVGTHNIDYVFTNSNGCEDTASDMVEVFGLPMVTETHQDVSECTGATNGIIDLTVADSGAFSFSWATTDGSGVVDGNEDQTSLSAGTYMVTVTNTATTCDVTLAIELLDGVDIIPPVIICPADVTISCVADQSVASLGMATATDNCDSSPMISFVDNADFTGCGGTGQITRTWTAVDSSNNEITCEQIIIIADSDAPVIAMTSTLEVVDCPQNIPAPLTLTAIDECAGPITIMPEITTIDQICSNEFTRVYTYSFVDDCGNETIITQSYQVITSQPILVSSPPDQTVTCELDIILYPHLVNVNSSCDGLLEVSATLNGPFGSDAAGCTGTTYEAVYSWTDGCHADSVVQVYTLENEGPEFVCPPDICIIDCSADNDMIQNQFDDYAGLAIVNTSCYASEVTITNDFSGNNFINNSCGTGSSIAYPNTLEYQVVTFTATDACNRSTSCTALVVIVDGTPPEFNGTPLVGIASCGSDVQTTYDTWVNTQISRLDANDVCGDNAAIDITYSPQSPTVTNGITSVTPVTFTASDDCGNSSAITVSFVVESEGGGPGFAQIPADISIMCNELPVVFGNITLSENCSPATITFEDAYVSGDASSCDNQEVAILQRTWTATDAAGNTATASQQITITPDRAIVAGTILTPENELVADVQLAVYLNNGMMDEQMTTESGAYEFELATQENYEITANRNDNPLNGITTYDLILLGQHLLELSTLDSPYKLIAADVNNSGAITSLDMISLRRMILLIDTAFPNNESWRFVDEGYVFPNEENPFLTTFPETHTINGLSSDMIKDFVAVKTGDLNQSAVVNTLGEGDTRDQSEPWTLEMEDEFLYKGQQYEIPVTIQEDGTLNGFQYTLDFDPELVEVKSVKPGRLKGMDANNFGTYALDKGWLTTSWHQASPINVIKGETLFILQLTANEDIAISELFSISSHKTPAEMYNGTTVLIPELVFNTSSEYKVYQNTPNPFQTLTKIGFEQPAPGSVSLKVFDVTGREVYHVKADFEGGYQEFELKRQDLSTSGVLFYSLEFKNYSNMKKMMLIE